MPITDSLKPAGLSTEAKKIVKSYGGWTGFMQSYALKPWDDDDAAEGKIIIESLAEMEVERKAEEAEEAEESKNTEGNEKA